MSKEEMLTNLDKIPFEIINELIRQCLKRDEGWKQFYKETMDSIEKENKSSDYITNVLELERKAEESFFKNETENAISLIQNVIDNYCANDSTEKGWYLQTLARYRYKLSKVHSIKTQVSAFNYNKELLKPKEGITYKKLDYINENRIRRIKDWIASHKNYTELIIVVKDILSNLSFGESSEKFEKALQDLGLAIGFLSQRPDKEFKKGPDNLWCGVDNEYFMFECKSEVDDSRDEIRKSETGQMNNHCGWFEQEYHTERVKRIIIIPTKKVSNQGDFIRDVEVMRKGKLKDLKNNVNSFFKEFKDYKISEVGDRKIQEWLDVHKLDLNSLKVNYSEKYYKKK